MSARARLLVAFIGLAMGGSCFYFAAWNECFEADGGWRTFSGCYGADGSSAGHREVVVRLVDSLHWRVEMGMDDEGDLWRVEVIGAGRVDTIPSVRVRKLPVVVGDSVITGLGYVEGALQSGFRYLIGAVRVDTIPLVEAIRRGWIPPELSPDGRWIAYWTLTGPGEGRIEVAEWPGQGGVQSGVIHVVGATDATPGGAAWVGADTLEYAIWAEEGRVLKGRWTPSGFTPVDTTTAD